MILDSDMITFLCVSMRGGSAGRVRADGAGQMGLGYALSEQFVMEGGKTLNATFLDDKIPFIPNAFNLSTSSLSPLRGQRHLKGVPQHLGDGMDAVMESCVGHGQADDACQNL